MEVPQTFLHYHLWSEKQQGTKASDYSIYDRNVKSLSFPHVPKLEIIKLQEDRLFTDTVNTIKKKIISLQ